MRRTLRQSWRLPLLAAVGVWAAHAGWALWTEWRAHGVTGVADTEWLLLVIAVVGRLGEGRPTWGRPWPVGTVLAALAVGAALHVGGDDLPLPLAALLCLGFAACVLGLAHRPTPGRFEIARPGPHRVVLTGVGDRPAAVLALMHRYRTAPLDRALRTRLWEDLRVGRLPPAPVVIDGVDERTARKIVQRLQEQHASAVVLGG